MTHIETLQAVSEAIASQVEHKLASRARAITVQASAAQPGDVIVRAGNFRAKGQEIASVTVYGPTNFWHGFASVNVARPDGGETGYILAADAPVTVTR